MKELILHIINPTSAQREALTELADILNLRFSEDGIPVYLSKTDENRVGFEYSDKAITLFYQKDAQFYRALGLFVESERKGHRDSVIEKPWHTQLTPMVDCSRNAVNTVHAIKQFVRHIALMGYDSMMIYTEDTYEIKKYPYFGHMRGRYSAEEIREIDQYCQLFGIELIPCIQVLAHLNALLRWKSFDELFDVNDILLVDNPKTYEFIEDMLQSVTSMFTSKQINLGMDEAFLLGAGKYQEEHGYQKRADIMKCHLSRVMELCRKYGLKPMIWSDMFFRTSNEQKTRHYYDTKTPLPEGIQETAPKDLSLVFWDYYHKERSIIDKLIELHQTFDNDIVFAGGGWKWKGFTPFNEVSFVYSHAALESCRNHGVTRLILTLWNESGSECSLFSILPTLQYFAEYCYRPNYEKDDLESRFFTCTQGILEDFMKLDLVNRSDKNPVAEDKEAGLTNPPNPCRYLLWQDLLQGLFDKHVENNVKAEDYTRLIPLLTKASARNPRWSYIFDNAASLCEVLALKAEAGLVLRNAYLSKDNSKLQEIADILIPTIIERVKRLHQTFYQQWMTENKVFGYDIMDMRFGALTARLQTARNRILDYLNGTLDLLPELGEERLWVDCRPEDSAPTDVHVHHWWQCATVSVLD